MTNVNKQKTVLDVNVLLNLPSAKGKLYLCYCLLQTINWSCCGLFKVRKKIHIRAGAHWGKQRGRVKSKLSHSCFWMKTLYKKFLSLHLLISCNLSEVSLFWSGLCFSHSVCPIKYILHLLFSAKAVINQVGMNFHSRSSHPAIFCASRPERLKYTLNECKVCSAAFLSFLPETRPNAASLFTINYTLKNRV